MVSLALVIRPEHLLELSVKADDDSTSSLRKPPFLLIRWACHMFFDNKLGEICFRKDI